MIERKKKLCVQCLQEKYIFSKGRCQQCEKLVSVVVNKLKKKEKKESTKELTKKLDEVFSKWLRKEKSIDGETGQCYTCKKFDLIKNLQCGHYISRKYLSLRWEPENTFIQCYYCNIEMSGNYRVFTDNLIQDFGQEYIDKLESRKNNLVKMTKEDYKLLIQKYEQ